MLTKITKSAYLTKTAYLSATSMIKTWCKQNVCQKLWIDQVRLFVFSFKRNILCHQPSTSLVKFVDRSFKIKIASIAKYAFAVTCLLLVISCYLALYNCKMLSADIILNYLKSY